MTTNWATWLASTKPNVQPLRRITVRSAASWRSQCQRSPSRPAPRRLGTSATHCSTTPREVPRPSSTMSAWLVSSAGQAGAPPGQEAEPDQDGDADQVVDDRRPGHGDEAPLGVEERGGQREDAVGGDLDHEPAQQRGGDGALGRDGVDEVGVRRRIERGQRRDEGGGQHQRRHRRGHEDDDRDREHGRDGLERLVLAPVGELVRRRPG